MTQTAGQEALVADALPSFGRRGRHSASHQTTCDEKCFQLPVPAVPLSQGHVVKPFGLYEPQAVTQAAGLLWGLFEKCFSNELQRR